MLWLLVIVAGLLGLLLLIAAIGLALPRDHVAVRTAVLAKTPDEIWHAIANVDAYPTWRRNVSTIERVSPNEFRETSSHGTIRYQILEDRAPSLRITEIADPSLPYGGRWIYELTADGSTTRLTITEDGFIKNPVFRFLSRTIFSTTSTLEHYLDDLSHHLNVPTTVEPTSPSPRVRSR